MKIDTKLFFMVRPILVAGFLTLFSSSFVNAWTIQTLNPSSYLSGYDPFNGYNVTTFTSYINGTGATLIQGPTLGQYIKNSADAVVINLPSSGYSYTQTELNVITDLLNSNTRVLIFGEHPSWKTSDEDLAKVVGGSYLNQYGGNDQTVNPLLFPLITEGVSQVTFAGPGKISPNNGKGLSLTSDDTISIWGANNNFLVFMDVNALADNDIGSTDNRQLAQNVASFLAGAGWSPIPEPSTYGLIAGFVLLGGSMIRRRR